MRPQRAPQLAPLPPTEGRAKLHIRELALAHCWRPEIVHGRPAQSWAQLLLLGRIGALGGLFNLQHSESIRSRREVRHKWCWGRKVRDFTRKSHPPTPLLTVPTAGRPHARRYCCVARLSSLPSTSIALTCVATGHVRARNPRPTLKTMPWESTGWPSVVPLHPRTFPLSRKRRASLSTGRTLGRALPAGRHDARHIGFRRAREGG